MSTSLVCPRWVVDEVSRSMERALDRTHRPVVGRRGSLERMYSEWRSAVGVIEIISGSSYPGLNEQAAWMSIGR